jgi:hypothetical protein
MPITPQMSARVQVSGTELDKPVGMSHRHFSVSILEEGGRLGLKCLLLSDFRVVDISGWATIRS